MCAWQVQAQEREVEEKDDIFSKVRIDTIHIKATPYERVLENGVWKDEYKQIDYYNDITIYEISKKESGQPSAMMTGPKAAIFMLPGGGFFRYAASDTIGMVPNRNGSITLGSKLAASASIDAKVFMIFYEVNPDTLVENSVLVKSGTSAQNCKHLQNETGRARTLEASYKAFRDLRKILKVNYLDSAAHKNIDPDNFFMIGSSAGAVLVINSMFLDSTEIPSSITYRHVDCSTATTTLSIDSTIRKDYWPMPPMKGIVTMAGAWIYDSLQLVNAPTASTFSTAIYMMHGTCDELITRRAGRIGFRLKNFVTMNTFPANRFVRGLGSEVIFNSFKNVHNHLAYGQVLKGGHSIFSPQSELLFNGWDLYNNSLSVITDTVFNKVFPFINGLKNNTLNWETRAFSWKPARESIVCNTGIDQPNSTICFQKIYNPNTDYTSVLCDNNIKQAIVQYSHSDASYSWTISSGANISFVGANSGTTIQYKRVANINKIDTLKVTIARPCAETKVFAYVVQSTNAAPFTATLTPSGWDTICATNKTATLSGLPVGTPQPVWTASPLGNVEIVSFSGYSVTYKRKSNVASSGILTATFTINGCESSFNFTVATLPTLGNWINTFGVVSQCDFGIVSNSPSKVPDGTNATFSTIYSNAAQNGVTNLQWSSNCIVVNETQIWIGNDLREVYTITASPGCTFVQVRPQNTCGFGSWKSTGISVESCGGGGWGMMLAPNPANSFIEIMLLHDDREKILKTYAFEVIDATGNTVIKTVITGGRLQYDISSLKDGVYKAIVQTDDEFLFRTFFVGR